MTATFTMFETARGARITRLPLQAFPGFWAYVYVLQQHDQCILIDTGSGTDTSHDDLLKGLNVAGLDPADLTHILLTHAHIDHYGGLTKLKPLTSAKLGCHELDVQTVAHHEARQALTARRLASFFAESGLAKEEAEALLSIYRFTKGLYRSVPVDFTYNEISDHVPGLDVVHLPGHCPGHVALRLDSVIFCGDMVVQGVTPHLTPESVAPYNGLDRYLESLERFRAWAKAARWILNGHDEVITDLPAQIDATYRNILRRMSKAVECLREPRTILEVCNAVYGNPGGYTLFLALEKAGVYLEYLYEHGMVEVTNPGEVEQGLPAKYQRLREIADDEILPKHINAVVE